MVTIARKYFLWWFSSLSLCAAFLSYQYAGKVFSIINLSITQDRQDVLAQAKIVAQEQGWDLDGYQAAVMFDSQDELQCFVELEAGGKDAFVNIFQSGAYYPYHWTARF